jgi:AhpD family alkylhydroperoxidase
MSVRLQAKKQIIMERITYKDMPNGFLTPLLKVQEYVDTVGLDRKLLHLLRMRVSQINGCAYCLDMHSKEGIHDGDTLQRLVSVSVWREAPYYSAKEMAALEFAERLTNVADEKDSEDIHDKLAEHFSKHEIAYLTLAIMQINSWNRLVRSFGTLAGTYQVKEVSVH